MWVARDKSRQLFMYENKPKKGFYCFTDFQGAIYHMPSNMLPEVTWENSPKEVKSIKIEV